MKYNQKSPHLIDQS